MACVLACGFAAPAVASMFGPANGAGNTVCAEQSALTDRCPGGSVLASADDLAAIGLSAQPLAPSAQSATPGAQGAEQAAAQVRVSEVASLLIADRSAGAAGNSAAPALFWVFGSGLLGAAFVARRRKPALRKA